MLVGKTLNKICSLLLNCLHQCFTGNFEFCIYWNTELVKKKHASGYLMSVKEYW